MSTMRDRVIRYYNSHDPNKVKQVDELLQSNRFSEQALMAALVAKYGTDSTRDSRFIPQLKSNVVNYEYIESPSGERPTSGTTPGDALTQSRQDQKNVLIESIQKLEGGNVVSQMVMQHLQSVDMGNVADIFRLELESYNFPKNYYQQELSELALPAAEQGKPSALAMLLCPHSKLREKLHKLLQDPELRIVDADPTNRRDEITMKYLAEMVTSELWMESADQSSPAVFVRKDTGQIRAASLNHIVENMTVVFLKSHLSIPAAVLAQHQTLIMSVLATHQHFTSSQALLAKLLQRFFVPSSLAFADVFNQHGIHIACPGSIQAKSFFGQTQKLSPRMMYWVQISRLLQIKVTAVISQWLSHFPQHFTADMMDAVKVWVEECCYTPTIWADAPTELMQCAEVIKLRLAAIMGTSTEDMAAKGNSTNGNIGMGSVTGPRGGVSTSKARRETLSLLFTRHKSMRQMIKSEGQGEDFGMNPMSRTPATIEGSTARSDFLDIDELRLALQITATDVQLFRNIDPQELHLFATNNGVGSLHSTNHPATSLNIFLRQSEEVMFWVVTEILQPNASTQIKVRIVEKFVTLAFRLLDVNNLHSAFAVVAGLNHPAVTRLAKLHHSLSPSVTDGLEELEKMFCFENGYTQYKTYLSSLPDNDVYPVIPLVQVWVDEIRKLTCIEPTILLDNNRKPLVHWRKFDVMGAIYRKMMEYQNLKVPPEFSAINQSVAWLNERFAGAVHDPERLLAMSFQLESLRQ